MDVNGANVVRVVGDLDEEIGKSAAGKPYCVPGRTMQLVRMIDVVVVDGDDVVDNDDVDHCDAAAAAAAATAAVVVVLLLLIMTMIMMLMILLMIL